MCEAELIDSKPKPSVIPANPNEMIVSVMNMTEKEYRAYPALSYSKLSDIEKVGILAVNANVASIGKLRGVILGSVVDDVISNKLKKIPEYVKFIDKVPGSGTVTERAIESIIENFEFTDFYELDKNALEHHLGANRFMMNGMNQANFYQKLSNYVQFINASKSANEDTQIATMFDKSIIIKAIKRLRSIPYFSSSFEDTTEQAISFQNKFLAVINGVEIKCMLDAIKFNHVDKTITPIDIKTGAMKDSDFNSFYLQAYLKYNYYIQAGLYKVILVEYFKKHPIYFDYVVEDFRFVYSTTNPKHALSTEHLFIHTIDKKMYVESFKGFEYEEGGKKQFKLGIGHLVKFYKDNLVK